MDKAQSPSNATLQVEHSNPKVKVVNTPRRKPGTIYYLSVYPWGLATGVQFPRSGDANGDRGVLSFVNVEVSFAITNQTDVSRWRRPQVSILGIHPGIRDIYASRSFFE